ncbi:hypothetical protein ACFQ36_17140 [Arthrobacter sp. GCM10027362]|uniref:hypothetical protein n=1 Tax=Arthrobacter sp. GCM10027362 TaxID=3273379 RepID=UPI0036347134
MTSPMPKVPGQGDVEALPCAGYRQLRRGPGPGLLKFSADALSAAEGTAGKHLPVFLSAEAEANITAQDGRACHA